MEDDGATEHDRAPEGQPLDCGLTEAPQSASLSTAGQSSLSRPRNEAAISFLGREVKHTFGIPVRGRPVPASLTGGNLANGAGLVLADGEGGPPPPMPPSVSSAPGIIDSGAKRGRSLTASPTPSPSAKAPRGPSPRPASPAVVPVPPTVPTPSSSSSLRRPKAPVNQVLKVVRRLSREFIEKGNPSRGLLELPEEAKGERPVNVMDFFCKPQLIGKGGFGQAYQVMRKDNGELMVLKLVLAATNGDGGWKYPRAFRREMRAVHALANSDKPYKEFVVEHIYYGMCEEVFSGVRLGYMAMPRAVDSLSDYIFEVDETTLLLHVARGLTCLHSHGLVHGDIKDGNVLVFGGPDDAIFKISDLGNCRLIDQNDLTAPGPCILYCSPQQLLRCVGEDQTTAGSDVWNLGAWAASRQMGEGGSLFAPQGFSIVSLLQRSLDGRSQALLLKEIFSLYETTHMEAACPHALFKRFPEDEALRLKNEYFGWLAGLLHFTPEERGSMEQALAELETFIAAGVGEADKPSIFQL